MAKKFDLSALVPAVEVVEVLVDSVTLEKSIVEAMVKQIEAADVFVQKVIDLAVENASELPEGFIEQLVSFVEAFAAVGDEDPDEETVPLEVPPVEVGEETPGPIRKLLTKFWESL